MIDLMNYINEIKDGDKKVFLGLCGLNEQKLRINGEREGVKWTWNMPGLLPIH